LSAAAAIELPAGLHLYKFVICGIVRGGEGEVKSVS
jgi:hypothetical protein